MTAKKESERQNNFFDTCNKCKTSYSCCNDTTPPIARERKKVIEAYLKEKKIIVAEPFERTEYTFPRLNASHVLRFPRPENAEVHGASCEARNLRCRSDNL